MARDEFGEMMALLSSVLVLLLAWEEPAASHSSSLWKEAGGSRVTGALCTS